MSIRKERDYAEIAMRTLWIGALIAAMVLGVALSRSLGSGIGPQLQAVSVNVQADNTQGSGTIFLVLVDGEQAAWILTANHVIDKLREVRSVIGPDGKTRKVIRYADASIIQEQVLAGRTVGEIRYDAAIVSVDTRRDIALLRVRRGDFTTSGSSFYLGKSIPTVGTEIYHCGAPGGKETGGTCSLTGGIISRIGVRIPGFGGGSEYGIFDQTDTAALGGSSGGMIALKSDGRYIGMITLGLSGGDNFHWIVPARSITAWAEEIGVMWLFDPSIDRPTEKEIRDIVLESNSSRGSMK